jgi:hypothetical protein
MQAARFFVRSDIYEYDSEVRLHDLKLLSVSVFPFVSGNKLKKTLYTTIYAIFENMGHFLLHPSKNDIEILWHLLHYCWAYETNAWNLPTIMSRSFPYASFSNLFFFYVMTSFNPLQSLDANSLVTYKKCILHTTLHNTL